MDGAEATMSKPFDGCHSRLNFPEKLTWKIIEDVSKKTVDNIRMYTIFKQVEEMIEKRFTKGKSKIGTTPVEFNKYEFLFEVQTCSFIEVSASHIW